MADQATSLPVRTEADGTDERLHVKVVDGTTPTQRMTVDTDKNAHVEAHGNDPAGVDRVVRTSELGALTPDGVYDAANNTKPGNTGLVGHTRAASPGDSDQGNRLTAITSGTVHALDISLHDATGAAFSAGNPLPISLPSSTGTPVNDYNTAAAIAAGASSNHDYTVTALMTLRMSQVEMAASGKAKLEVRFETGVATGVFNTKWVLFNSTSEPNISLHAEAAVVVAAGVRVRLVRTNKDNQAQDLYSTISGFES